MSHSLYLTILQWSNGRGVAKLHGRLVRLDSAPVLAGIAVHAVDYVPEIHLQQVQRTPLDRTLDMEPAEIADADALLWRLAPPPPRKEARDAAA